MGWLFHTPSDDATEATLKALHWQNTLDNYYERGWGWACTLLFTAAAVFITSWVEMAFDMSIWDRTVDWFVEWAQAKIDSISG